MADALALALATPGLAWLVCISFSAGAVYGFAGFGAALVFMPLATIFVPPPVAVAMISVSSIGSAATVLPQAWRTANLRAALTMLGVALLFTPLGLLVLRQGDPSIIRWAVSAVVFATLAVLLTGWRYTTQPGPRTWAGVGGMVGFVGGCTGLNGPPLVLFQLAGQDAAAVTRSNTIVVLTLSSLSFVPFMALQGALPVAGVALGFLLLVPYGLGGFVGRRLFSPDHALLYRRVAYAIVGLAGVLGLPVWG